MAVHGEHKGAEKERTEVKGVRAPASLWSLLEAAQKRRGLASRNDAAVEALHQYVERYASPKATAAEAGRFPEAA